MTFGLKMEVEKTRDQLQFIRWRSHGLMSKDESYIITAT